MLTSEQARLLCLLADPEKEACDVPAAWCEGIAEAGVAHGVAAILLRKFAERCGEGAIETLRTEVVGQTGLRLQLASHVRDIRALIEAEKLNAAIVKGPVFSEKLYAHAGDRPFTDLDILATPEARALLGEYLASRGFHLHRKRAFDNTEANQEEKWGHGEMPSLLIELHGNLVHYAGLRRRVGFGYEELARIDPGNKESPSSLFFTAVVHAALGHKFHELRLLVDVLQAFRRLDDSERALVGERARKLRLGLETSVCLHLIAGLFGENEAEPLAVSVDSGALAALSRRLVTPDSVLLAPWSAMSRVRRHAFRRLQHVRRA